MNVIFKNVGVVKFAEIDLQKDFTVFCGHNSTGKTYVSMLLYAILATRTIGDLPLFKSLSQQLRTDGQLRISKDLLGQYLAAYRAYIKNNLGLFFGISDEKATALFPDFDVEFVLTEADYQNFYHRVLGNRLMRNGNLIIGLHKEKDSDVAKFDNHENSDMKEHNVAEEYLYDNLISLYLRNVCFGGMSQVRMLTVERNSIYTFKTELSLSRNAIIDQLLESEREDVDLSEVLNSGARRYPMPIRDSLRIANDLDNVQKRKGYCSDLAAMLENKLLHGEMVISQTGDVEFSPQNVTEKRLPIHLSSSIVKTMSSLVFYLKYLSRKNDLVIIDEPEMNFHPDCQVLLPHVFAQMVKRGVKIVMSTHSDYIIRELNNMVMAYHLYEKGKGDVAEKAGYVQDGVMNPAWMAVKYFGEEQTGGSVAVSNVEMDEFGFSILSIDEAIEKQNDVTDMLYEHLKYD